MVRWDHFDPRRALMRRRAHVLFPLISLVFRVQGLIGFRFQGSVSASRSPPCTPHLIRTTGRCLQYERRVLSNAVCSHAEGWRHHTRSDVLFPTHERGRVSLPFPTKGGVGLRMPSSLVLSVSLTYSCRVLVVQTNLAFPSPGWSL